jgi:hypothetical protein
MGRWASSDRHDTGQVAQGIDRLVRNVEHGRFERAPSP